MITKAFLKIPYTNYFHCSDRLENLPKWVFHYPELEFVVRVRFEVPCVGIYL